LLSSDSFLFFWYCVNIIIISWQLVCGTASVWCCCLLSCDWNTGQVSFNAFPRGILHNWVSFVVCHWIPYTVGPRG
jgi:hypothetical protein